MGDGEGVPLPGGSGSGSGAGEGGEHVCAAGNGCGDGERMSDGNGKSRWAAPRRRGEASISIRRWRRRRQNLDSVPAVPGALPLTYQSTVPVNSLHY